MFHHGLPSAAEDEVVEATSPLSPSSQDSPSSDATRGEDTREEEREEEQAARPPTPPMVQMILDMGFSRAQVNVALQRSVQ